MISLGAASYTFYTLLRLREQVTGGPVAFRMLYICGECGMAFYTERDRTRHEYFAHGDML
ncbi:hypothetical protein BDB00DRAFT_820748, partial [Zychaea mexicana]|uniref:uncharacterized protein n=1 Tax=Zychaea mexicana TaxID=64656 RepID=UPI0022FEDBCB